MTIPKILIVDDESDVERLFRQRLRKEIRAKEFELVFALNGQEALEYLKDQPRIDLVLTDINMPVMDGLTFISKLQEVDATLKAVVVSAYGDLENIRNAMNLGAFDFLTKPINFDDLILTVRKAFKLNQEIRENIEKLQTAQMQLIQSEKMSTLGQLVAGVAHEINNPTGFVFSNLDCVESYTKDLVELIELYQKYHVNLEPEIEEKLENIDLDFLLEDLHKMLGSMKVGLERIRNISHSLRTFSRSDTTYKVDFDLHAGIDSTLLILKHRLKATDQHPAIEIVKNYGDLPPVQCFPGQLNQVFMNVLANAIDALEEINQGRTFEEIKDNPNRIIIKTEFIQMTDAENLTQDTVVIRIIDNGAGMTDSVKQHIFDHLYTTKAVGKGTGLGLTIAHQIVSEKHGGTIEVNSILAQGTEFIISIPVNP